MRAAGVKDESSKKILLVKMLRDTPKGTTNSARNKKRIQQILSGNFESLKKWLGCKELCEYKTFEEKVDAYVYYQSQIDALRKQGHFVWPPDKLDCSVYVIRLTSEVWNAQNDKLPKKLCEKLREENSEIDIKKCKGFLYVGQTSKSVEERFDQHLTPRSLEETDKPGKLANALVFHCHDGDYPDAIFRQINNLREADSLRMEAELGTQLRREGYATYWR